MKVAVLHTARLHPFSSWRLVRMSASCAYDVVATVPTGLERSAAEECRETLGPGREVLAHRGAISCRLERSEELSKVRSSARVLP